MKSFAFFLPLMVVIFISGCAFHKAKPAATVSQPIVTPDNSLTATVVSYNSVGRFVVLSFPVGQMPKTDQIFFLYRGGLKVGEIKITGPQRDNDTVADLITGDAQVGDEVRNE